MADLRRATLTRDTVDEGRPEHGVERARAASRVAGDEAAEDVPGALRRPGRSCRWRRGTWPRPAPRSRSGPPAGQRCSRTGRPQCARCEPGRPSRRRDPSRAGGPSRPGSASARSWGRRPAPGRSANERSAPASTTSTDAALARGVDHGRQQPGSRVGCECGGADEHGIGLAGELGEPLAAGRGEVVRLVGREGDRPAPRGAPWRSGWRRVLPWRPAASRRRPARSRGRRAPGLRASRDCPPTISAVPRSFLLDSEPWSGSGWSASSSGVTATVVTARWRTAGRARPWSACPAPRARRRRRTDRDACRRGDRGRGRGRTP